MKLRIGFFCLILLLVASLALTAQDSRGNVQGRVLDSSGAQVPNAEVRITNDATGVVATGKTNEAGNFYIPYLVAGNYTLTCELAGFKKYVRPGIQIRVGENVDVPVQLEIGSASESIEVKDTTPLLATSESSLGQVVDERRILELPLFAGNAMDLVHLAPGTTNNTNLRLRKAPFNNAPSDFSTDGTGAGNNEFMLDGVTNTFSNGTSPRVAFSPPRSSIGEFKVQTSAFDASIGHSMGSTVNVSTKGGTNALHGEAHYWFRNAALDAATIFQNRTNTSPPVYTDNLYGFSLGGPVVIPKVYNGKNKTFYFFAWEANKFGDPANAATSSVPTALMRQGNLSEWLALGPTYQLYDPKSTTALPNGTFTRTPIPGNIIPSNMLDPVAMNMMKYYPLPNQAGTREQFNNFFYPSKALEDYWVWVARIDHTFTQNNRMFLRLNRDYWEEDKNRIFGPNDPCCGIILNRNNKGLAFDDVHVFSPTFILDFRYGLTYQDFPERRVSQGFDLATLGFSPQMLSLIPNKSLATFPRTAPAPWTTLSQWESGDGYASSMTHSFVGTFTKLKGNHNMRFGAEYRVYREDRNRYPTEISPDFSYPTGYTNGPLNTSAAPNTGAAVAAMFYGIPGGTMSYSASYAEQDLYWAGFFQDDWRITRNLTLNLGLRWEYETPITERFNRASIHFLGDAVNPVDAQAQINYAQNPIPEIPVGQFRSYGGLTFANANGNPRHYWDGEIGNLAPRIGLAWQLSPTTVLRGGFGMFYNTIGVNRTDTSQAGFSQNTPVQASLDNGVNYVATNANPFPNGLLPATGTSAGLRTSLGQNVLFFNDARKQPYSMRWSMGFQTELPHKFIVEAAYVGNKSVRLNLAREQNGTYRQYLSTSPTRDQATITYLGQNYKNPYYGLDPIYTQNMSRANFLRPYPEFGNVTINGDPSGYAWYNSLQARVERRFASGWTLQGSYTWSKAMDATEFLNPTDPMPSRVISAGDRTNRATASSLWEIPFGKGRMYGGSINRFADFFVGGWQLGFMYQHQSGGPLGFGNRIITGSFEDMLLPSGTRGVNAWFRPANEFMVTNSSQQLASNIRTMPLRYSNVRGPTQDRLDISMIKYFKITERWQAQFRVESYNALNHPNLYNPGTDPTSTNWGVITGQDSPRSFQLALKITF